LLTEVLGCCICTEESEEKESPLELLEKSLEVVP
jgi:hypothetical protein